MGMTPDYEYNDKCHIRFFNCDNMEFMKDVEDKYDLAIVDPPYGLDNKITDGGTWAKKWQTKGAKWDVTPKKEYFDELFRISKEWIIFGANYFIEHLPNCRNFIAWHKPYMDGMHTMSNVELALTSFDINSKKISFNKDNNIERIHITQKPIKLYRWLLQNYAKQGDKILDTHGGSMTLARACYEEGFDLDIMELDKEYFDKGVLAFKQHVSQQKLF